MSYGGDDVDIILEFDQLKKSCFTVLLKKRGPFSHQDYTSR